MKKLLFLTPELPYPGHSGGKLKSLKLLERLAREYQVTLACPLKLDDSEHVLGFLSQEPGVEQLLTQPTDVPRSARNLLRSYLAGVPLNVLRTANRELADGIAEIIDEHDVVFIDHYEVGQYVPDHYRGQRVYHAHNAYHKLWERYAEQGVNPAYRLAAALEAVRVKRAEVALCGRCELVFASPNDIDALAAAGVPRWKMCETYHLGDDANLARPALRRADAEQRLLYVGNLAWEPNAIGLRWFLEQVWPQLKVACPALQLDVAGRDADARLQQLATASDGVHLHGFVEDLECLWTRASISIAPLTFGAGMKVKVLSAMARGLPVVTTPVGAEGIDAEHGRHLLVAENPASMVADILRLLDDAALWQRLAEESRALVARRYNWNSMFASMLSAMQAVEAQCTAPRLTPEIKASPNPFALEAAS